MIPDIFLCIFTEGALNSGTVDFKEIMLFVLF